MTLFESIVLAFLSLLLFRVRQILQRLKAKPHERNMLGYLRVTVNFGGDPDKPLFFASFPDLWDWAYGWMLTCEQSEDELHRFVSIQRVTSEGLQDVGWSEYPQNKESRERSIQRWMKENLDLPEKVEP